MTTLTHKGWLRACKMVQNEIDRQSEEAYQKAQLERQRQEQGPAPSQAAEPHYEGKE